MNASESDGRGPTAPTISPRAAAASARLRAWIARGKAERRKAWRLGMLGIAIVVAKESALLVARRDEVRAAEWVPVASFAPALLVSAALYLSRQPRRGEAV